MAKILLLVVAAFLPLSAGPLSPYFSVPITATAIDSSNNLYIAGIATVANLPMTAGAFQTTVPACSTPGCTHGFLAKISAQGFLIFATYLTDGDNEYVDSIAVTAGGEILISGSATSFANAIGAGAVGFVDRIRSDGTAILASKKIGSATWATIAMGPSGDIFVAGRAASIATTPGAFQSSTAGGDDAFVIRYDRALANPVYTTLIGGAGSDGAYAIAVDGDNNAYVTGITSDMRTFPQTPGAVVENSPSGEDVFVVKLNASGSAVVFSALFAPADMSFGAAIALDSTGIYVAGLTNAPNFPLPQGTSFIGGTGFAAKLSPDGFSVLYRTRLPGPFSSIVPPTQIGVDQGGGLMIFSIADGLVPTTADSFSPCTAGFRGNYILRLDATGTLRTYGSYIPGGLAARADGEVWYADSFGVVRTFNIHDPLPPGPRCVADSLTYLSGPIAPGKLVSLFGPGIGPDRPATLQIDASGKAATYLGGLSVYFNGVAAPLLYVAKNQINAVVPFEVGNAPDSTVVLLKDGVRLDGPSARLSSTALSLFTTGTYNGCSTAAVNLDGSLNGPDHPASPGSAVMIFGEGAGVMANAQTGEIATGAGRIAAQVNVGVQLTDSSFHNGPPLSAPVPILYAGDAPGAVEGVFQMNVQLPVSFPGTSAGISGQQRLNIGIGSSTTSTCVWLR